MYATVHEPTISELTADMPLVSDIPAVQAFYEHARLQGTSHKLAEMFAFQQPPACMTDNVFNEGRNGNQWEKNEWMGDWYAQTARAQGVNISGATYLHSLAAFPGDPKAWVRTRGDVQRVCEERGWGCRGAVAVKAQEPLDDPRSSISVADDIVEQQTQGAIAADPAVAERARRNYGEVRHEVAEKLRPHWTRRKIPKKKEIDLAA